MQVPRLYTEQDLKTDSEILLSDSESHYLLNVLRLKPGRKLLLFNGKGGEYQSELIAKEKRKAAVKVCAFDAIDNRSPLGVHLVQGLSRGERMDYVVQKSVEMGVSSITPIITERCGVKLDKKRTENRLQHWRKVMISACEQSGRCHLAEIHTPILLSEWLQHSVIPGFVCELGSHHTVAQYKQNVDSEVALLIGPEGGFTLEENQHVKAAGIHPLGLGPRVLRTETATVAALTLLQAAWGDLANYSGS